LRTLAVKVDPDVHHVQDLLPVVVVIVGETKVSVLNHGSGGPLLHHINQVLGLRGR
jgi:hypothetical protein